MDTIATAVWILLILELIEAAMQYAPDLEGVLNKLYAAYRRSVFLFFTMHPSFIFVLYVSIATDTFNGWIVAILALKIFDIFYKIEMIKARYIRREVPAQLQAMLAWRIPAPLFLSGALLYPFLLHYALS